MSSPTHLFDSPILPALSLKLPSVSYFLVAMSSPAHTPAPPTCPATPTIHVHHTHLPMPRPPVHAHDGGFHEVPRWPDDVPRVLRPTP